MATNTYKSTQNPEYKFYIQSTQSYVPFFVQKENTKKKRKEWSLT